MAAAAFDLRLLTRAQLEAHVRRTFVLKQVLTVVYESEFLANNDQVRSRICCIGSGAAYAAFLRDFERKWLAFLAAANNRP